MTGERGALPAHLRHDADAGGDLHESRRTWLQPAAEHQGHVPLERADALAVLPKYHVRRPMLLGMIGLAQSLAADRQRTAVSRDARVG